MAWLLLLLAVQPLLRLVQPGQAGCVPAGVLRGFAVAAGQLGVLLLVEVVRWQVRRDGVLEASMPLLLPQHASSVPG